MISETLINTEESVFKSFEGRLIVLKTIMNYTDRDRENENGDR